MGETVTTEASLVEIVYPAEAAAYDPTLTEWFGLPETEESSDGEIHCPGCDGRNYGTANPRGFLYVRVCHDERNIGCRRRFRTPMTIHNISKLCDAFTGMPQELPMGRPK